MHSRSRRALVTNMAYAPLDQLDDDAAVPAVPDQRVGVEVGIAAGHTAARTTTRLALAGLALGILVRSSEAAIAAVVLGYYLLRPGVVPRASRALRRGRALSALQRWRRARRARQLARVARSRPHYSRTGRVDGGHPWGGPHQPPHSGTPEPQNLVPLRREEVNDGHPNRPLALAGPAPDAGHRDVRCLVLRTTAAASDGWSATTRKEKTMSDRLELTACWLSLTTLLVAIVAMLGLWN